jgi:ABC-type nickel/cobalt efflux system permease component RcnA
MSELTPPLFLAASISDTVMGLLARGKAIVLAVVLVLVIVSVAQAYIRTRSWIPAIGAALIGGFALWMVVNLDTVQDYANDEVEQAPSDAGQLNDDIGNDIIQGGG